LNQLALCPDPQEGAFINKKPLIEVRSIYLIARRAGYRTDTRKELSDAAGFPAGIGLKILESEIACAYLPMDDLEDTHYFTPHLRQKAEE